MKNIKYALVLSGGGFRTAFQVGAINYLAQNWKKITGSTEPMKFDIISGVSGGALNGVMVSMDKLEQLNGLWLGKVANNGVSEIYNSEFIDTSSKADKLKLKIDVKALAKKLIPKVNLKMKGFEGLGLLFSKSKRKTFLNRLMEQIGKQIEINFPKFKSIASNLPLRRKLEKLLDQSSVKTFFQCGFVSLNTGKYHAVSSSEFDSNTDFVNGVMASTAMPMVWEPVESISFTKNGKQTIAKNNVDGGIMNVSPLGDTIKKINEDKDDCVYRVIVINCNNGVPKTEDLSNESITGITSRSIHDLMLTEIFNNDVQHFLEINEIAKHFKRKGKKVTLKGNEIKPFETVIIDPAPEADLGSPLVANKELIDHRFEQGFNTAAKAKYFNS